MTHTPGPWEINGTTIETTAIPAIVIGRAYDPEDSAGGIETENEALANARLIAAAPDMLAALKGFLLGAPSNAALADVVGEDVIREARAAIAKAEGKS